MLDVNVLSVGFSSLNSRAFLFPLIRYDDAIRERGISVSHFRERRDALTDCSTLIVHSKFYRYFWGERDQEVLDDLSRFAEEVDTLLWFDTTDSTSPIQTEVLPYVDGYYKNQVLKDKERYLEPLYGLRTFTQFYHDEFDVVDDQERRLRPVQSRSALDKIRVGWNFGLADYSLYQPITTRLFKRLPRKAFTLFPWDSFFEFPPHWTSPSRNRSVDVSGRFSTGQERETVRFQRARMQKLLSDHLDTSHVSRLSYWRELRNSKLLLSPFGWGEVCWRDFEGFLAGCVVVKPSMHHLKTWPPLYEAGETYLDVDWSLDDLEATVEDALERYDETRAIAERGQQRYRQYLVGQSARERFLDRFERIVR